MITSYITNILLARELDPIIPAHLYALAENSKLLACLEKVLHNLLVHKYGKRNLNAAVQPYHSSQMQNAIQLDFYHNSRAPNILHFNSRNYKSIHLALYPKCPTKRVKTSREINNSKSMLSLLCRAVSFHSQRKFSHCALSLSRQQGSWTIT